MTRESCYHCGLPVPEGSDFRREVLGEERAFCCPGCLAVAGAIVEAGLEDYYRHRTETPDGPPDPLAPLAGLDLYDTEQVQRGFVHVAEGDVREASLMLEGITCAACVWLSERHVKALPGVLDFSVNYSTHRARVRWDASRVQLSRILQAVHEIGYRAHPFDPGRQEASFKRERDRALRRLAVAGLGMMQVMMIAVALWLGHDVPGQEGMMRFLRWVALFIATPVVVYAGAGFFTSAWRDVRRRRLGMDVPVALAIGSTYLASVWATVTGSHEHVYFESVTMFVFFLLTGRYLEMSARQRAGQATEALGRLLPAAATRLTEAGEEQVSVTELSPGDRVRVRPGEAVPADGTVESGRSSVDESLLTGESMPRARGRGDRLTGGTMNVESPLVMQVERVGADTVLSAIQRLLDRAQTQKPRLAVLAERGTGWFVGAVLVLTALVGLAWWWIDPARAFWVMVAMLVVSCPCALALATPAAITAATGALTGRGLLTARGEALEGLASVTDMVFDKTGTLTEGRSSLREVVLLGAMDRRACLKMAAVLEVGSGHPVARALLEAAEDEVNAWACEASTFAAGGRSHGGGVLAPEAGADGDGMWERPSAAKGEAPDDDGPRTFPGLGVEGWVNVKEPRFSYRHSLLPLGGEGLGMRGRGQALCQSSPLTPTPLPAGERGLKRIFNHWGDSLPRCMSVKGKRVRLGSPRFVAELIGGEAGSHLLEVARQHTQHGTVVALGDETGPLALFTLEDRLRSDALSTVQALRERGLSLHVFSGDDPATVSRLARGLGIDDARGGLTPADKLEALEALEAQGARVAMVGDGVNDAPILSRATVSLAMAGGTQLAQASADMILYRDQLAVLPAGLDKARETARVIRQNIGWAIGYNSIALPVAALGLITPWIAALGMSLSSLLVVVNALRLRDQRLTGGSDGT
ncbi:heavy metal translocating P-type ATPase [Ectothiorhodospira marina]|uniref:P-type Cu(+) transporter n=1 Tax=Ectothiorhodospira marina TaxID=1396821 RepID=A0A1H7R8K1_9GAMM|nr:heavy metal translocating P-type ATPase [Ectothiorhodospira marina]SEL56308.1 ATPase, P-type (transporting), HAD superfamily, subfamily IC [Ectothiorhodospira marina]